MEQLRSGATCAESVVAIETMKRDNNGSYQAAQNAYRYYLGYLKQGVIVADLAAEQNGSRCAHKQCKGCYGKTTAKNTSPTLF